MSCMYVFVANHSRDEILDDESDAVRAHYPAAYCDDKRGICLRKLCLSCILFLWSVAFCMFGSLASALAMIRNIVGTRAEAPVAEQNHNCSPILSN